MSEILYVRDEHHRWLIPVTLWQSRHFWPTTNGLRALIFNSKSNGFDKCIRRIGRRILIDEAAFYSWVDQQGGGK